MYKLHATVNYADDTETDFVIDDAMEDIQVALAIAKFMAKEHTATSFVFTVAKAVQ